MAINTVNLGYQPQVGISYNTTVDGPGDYGSVSNSTYFYNLADGLPYFKDEDGDIITPFNAPPPLGNLPDVSVAGATTGQALVFNGTSWESGDVATNEPIPTGISFSYDGEDRVIQQIVSTDQGTITTDYTYKGDGRLDYYIIDDVEGVTQSYTPTYAGPSSSQITEITIN